MRPAETWLELSRSFLASPTRLFGCFAEPDLVARWWGPSGFSTPQVDFSPRPGASYRIAMQPPEGEAFHLHGEFTEVEPPSRLAFSFRWEPADPDDQETRVELTFREAGDPGAAGDSTELLLAQGPFRTEERRALHRDGWTESLDRLAELLAQ